MKNNFDFEKISFGIIDRIATLSRVKNIDAEMEIEHLEFLNKNVEKLNVYDLAEYVKRHELALDFPNTFGLPDPYEIQIKVRVYLFVMTLLNDNRKR